jgi:hypothetical protein
LHGTAPQARGPARMLKSAHFARIGLAANSQALFANSKCEMALMRVVALLLFFKTTAVLSMRRGAELS